MESLTIIGLDPAWVAVTVIALVAAWEYYIIQKIIRVSRSYAKMTVAKSRILADGKIIITEPDVPDFLVATFEFMEELESILHSVSGWIINHPSTGWIRGYSPQIRTGMDAAVTELASAPLSGKYVIETITPETKHD